MVLGGTVGEVVAKDRWNPKFPRLRGGDVAAHDVKMIEHPGTGVKFTFSTLRNPLDL